jgi:hypothetical protein
MSQLHIRGLSWFKLIFCIASSPQDILEQMNEGGGLIPSREARKKRRGSGSRYSSKKDLERSKLKTAAKTRASELASVTKAFPIREHSQVVAFQDQVVHSALRALRNKMVMRWI